MKRSLYLIPVLLLSLASCFHTPGFEKDFYERISGIKFPKKFSLIETLDNGETFTAVSLQVDSDDLINFIRVNALDTLKIESNNLFWYKMTFLKKVRPDFTNGRYIFVKGGRTKTNAWYYVADAKRKILWAEIQYPDWSGDNP